MRMPRIVLILLVSVIAAGCGVESTPLAPSLPQPAQPVPAPPPLQISPTLPDGSTMIVQKGLRVATLLGCRGCHGKDLQGGIFIDEPKFAILYASNLTRTLPHYNDEQLERAIREGVRPDGSPLWEMPSEAFTPLSAPDMQALIAYLRSIPGQGEDHPRMVLGSEGRKEIESGLIKPAPEKVRQERHISPAAAGENHEWGRYLVHTVCGECHGPDLRGNPDPETYRPDLIVAVSYPIADFRTLLKTGQPLGDRKLTLMAKVAKSRFSHLTDAEVDAMHGYLVARAGVAR